MLLAPLPIYLQRATDTRIYRCAFCMRNYRRAHVREHFAQQVRYGDKDNDETNRIVGVISNAVI